ncbi:PepSY-associated TM helix domain-containing protein [Roseicella frigidaeris]|uniref:PepSY domain-containing protein n=1 Tax=Roseicella frigidaeris TaxID=2230885 RepID=A0A327M499_9PROT|nr:PepSY-associated TM helix domain-containing protein [Roseicella frigidaeris]RAI57346.1 hypothetical protein DOO78_19275 [Roseicella frigidaeris]
MSAAIRHWLLLGHRWAGLLLGLVLLLIGVTGSILSFQREIEAALNPALFRASGPADPAITASAVQRIVEARGRQVGTIRPPDEVWPVWVVSPARGPGGGGPGGGGQGGGGQGGGNPGGGAPGGNVPGGGVPGGNAPGGNGPAGNGPGGGAGGGPGGGAPGAGSAPGGGPASAANAGARPAAAGAGAPSLTLYIDPATGAVLGERDTRNGFISITRQLHENLLLREWSGREIVGWLGVLTILFCVTGIWVWWPRDGAFGRALVQIRKRPSVVLNLDLHRVIGIWMAIVLLVVSVSGVAIIFPGWFRPLLGISAPAGGGPFGQATQPAQPPRREPMRVDADAAVAAALAHLPGQVVTGITPPTRQRQVWTLTLRPESTDPEVRARTFLTIDPWSGSVLEERGPRTRSLAEETLALQRWLHGGAVLGMPGRLLVFLSGLAMLVLFVTGLAAWLLRRRNRRRTRRRAEQAVALSGKTA